MRNVQLCLFSIPLQLFAIYQRDYDKVTLTLTPSLGLTLTAVHQRDYDKVHSPRMGRDAEMRTREREREREKGGGGGERRAGTRLIAPLPWPRRW